MNKVYDYRALIDAYLKIPLRDHVHQDFRDYYTGLVTTLEQLFDIQIQSVKKYPNKSLISSGFVLWPLWQLFESTVVAVRQGSVTGGWLEGGPSVLLSRLAKTNPNAAQTDKTLDEVVAQETLLKQKYRQLLYELFALIYGKTELTFTSEDLLRLGFDDSKEPDISD